MLKVQEIEPGNLHPWEGNPRLNKHAVAAVAESIRSFGFNVPILCDQNLTIIAGHTRRTYTMEGCSKAWYGESSGHRD